MILKHLAMGRWLPNCLFISFAFNANKKGTQTGHSIPHTMPWGRAGSVTFISQKSDSDKLFLVHFPTTRLHCSNTLAAEGAHPQLCVPGPALEADVPVPSLGKAVTCSSTAGKPTVSKAPGAVLPCPSREGSCLLQLPCRWLEAQAQFP